MNRLKIIFSTLLLFLIVHNNAISQCNTNISICTPGVAGPFTFAPASNNPSTCLDFLNGQAAPNYAYIILYITQGGELDLLIEGNQGNTGFPLFAGACLDVAIFDITGQADPCASLSPATEIGCNYVAPCEGCAEFGNTINGCAAQVGAPNVNTGDVIMILVEDYSDAQNNFTLQLGNGPNSAQTGPPDATITPVGPFCDDDPAIQLDAVDNGGVWSGPGVTAGGVFNPATAGPGTHTINYSIGQAPCNDASSTTITVNDCSGCFMNYFEANISACNPADNTFGISGTIEFTVPPAGGQLIVQDCNGNQQVFNPPFTSPTNYNITGIDSDGSLNCDITAFFTDDPACALTIGPFDYPASCVCGADVGTFTDGVFGDATSSNPWLLCFGDELDVIANGDFDVTENTSHPATYDPGIWLLVYDCPPTVGPPGDINTDPCLLGVASTFDQAWTIANTTGSGNTLYFVPVTMYSMVDGTYAIGFGGGDLCYDLGPTYPVTFLPEVTSTQVQDCQAGTATVTVNGGAPAFDGSNFTASNLAPASATFNNTTAANGGTITISGLEDGDNWSFDITDNNGCPISVSGVFQGVEDPAFTYPDNTYCQTQLDPAANVTGTPGGTFTSAPAGLVINAGSGLIDLSASTPGTYTVTYTTPDPICFDTETFVITVNPEPAIDPLADVTVCLEYILPAITGTDLTGGQSYYTGPGGTGTPLSPGDLINTIGTTTIYIYDETGTIPNCSDENSFDVTINPAIQDMTCPPALTAVCNITEQPPYADYNAFIAAGGSVTLPAGATVDPTTFNLLSEVSDGLSCPETITRTYEVTDDCGITVSCEQLITINDLENPVGNAPNNVTVQCPTDVPVVDINSLTGISDNCTANPIVTHIGDASDGNTCPEIITRTYRITDDCGNFIEVEQIITINDDTNPIGNPPANVAVQCPTDVPAVDINSLTGVSDNCTVNPTVAHVGDVSDGNVCPEIITRTYRIEDECGNFIEVDQIITINDDTAPTASNPAPIIVECLTDVPAPDVLVVTDEVDNCTITPTVAFVSEVSDNNVCNGEVITRTYSVIDDCGNSINVTQTITIDSYTPTFTLSYTDPSECGIADGTITVSDLDPNTTYTFEFNGNPAQNITTDANGDYIITGLASGSYSVFTVSDADCPTCSTTDNTSFNLIEPNAPAIDAGPNQQVCEGTTVTLTAINPEGATITWNNGVTDGVAFTPAVGSINYTVTADLAGCISSDVVNIIVYSVPLINPIADLTECDSYTLPAITGTNLTGNEAFFTAPNGGGTLLNPGDLITTAGANTIYIYDETGTTPNCFDETSFVVTINLTPVIDPLADVTECDSYTLPAITGTNLTGNEAYFTAPNGGGTQLNPGDLITTAGANTIYIYDETGTTPNCFDETSFVVTINLTPVIDPLADVIACDSYTLPVITGTNLSGNEAYFTDPNGGGTQLNPGDLITSAGANTIYIYDETSTTPNCFNETSLVVTINITPILDPVDNVEICDEFTFDVITGTNLTGNEAYYTDPNGGGIQYNSGDIFTTTGTSTIYVFDQTASIPACFNEVSFTIDISITPDFIPSSSNPSACAVNDGTITLSGLTPGETYNVEYTANGTPVGPIVLTADGAGDLIINGLTAGSYTEFVVEMNNCFGTDNTIINLVDPNAPAIDAGPDVEVCEGEDITLTAVNPEGAIITWNNGVNDGVPFNQAVGTVAYTVTANLDNCISTDVVNVTVHPTPIVFAGNDVTVCDGQSVVLTGTGAQSYVWTNGVTNGVAFTPAATQTYTVTGTSQFGCVSTDDVTVNVEELPEITFEGDVLEGCTPVTTTFTNNSATTAGSECVWYLSDGTVLSGCDNVAHTFTNPGCYDVTLEITSANGCRSSSTFEDYVCVQEYPVAYFTYSPNQPTTINTQVTFSNGSIGASNYEWFFGDGSTSNAVDPTHTYAELEETYEVTLVASTSFGCTDTARSIVNIVEELIFYVPNTFTPDGDEFNETFQPVFTSGFDPFDFHLMIFNRWGELIFESYDASIGWDGTYGGKANGADLVKDGTYVWKIEVKTKLSDERKMFVGHVNVLK